MTTSSTRKVENAVLYVWALPADEPAVARIQTALAQRGVTLAPLPVGRTGSPSDRLVVIVSPYALAPGSDLDRVAESWTGILLPVGIDDVTPHDATGHTAITARSWIYGQDALGIARRLSAMAHVSPDWLLAWDRVTSAAADHQRDGQSLLGRSALAKADELIAGRSRSAIPEVPEDVLQLIRASHERIRRRRRVVWSVLAGTIVVLAAVAIGALVQRQSAERARGRADRAADDARSDRLARAAQSYVGNDPDVPVLLADEAYAIAPNQTAREVLRAALDATPWHVAVRLPSLPHSVTADPDGHVVAVALEGGEVRLYRSRDGAALGTIPGHGSAGGTPVLGFSPDGRDLALAYNDGEIDVRTTSSPAASVRRLRARHRPASSLTVAWLRDRRALLTAWEGKRLTITDLTDGTTRSVTVASVFTPKAAVPSASGDMVAVVGDHTISLLEQPALRPCGSVPITGAPVADVAISRDETTLAIARQGIALDVPMPAGCQAREERAKVDFPLAGPGDAVATLGDGQRAFGTSTGRIVIQHSGIGYPAASFIAHTGRVADLAATGPRGLATVGSDHYLRVWTITGTTVSYPAGKPSQLLAESFSLDENRQIDRPMLAVSPNGRAFAIAGPSTGLLATTTLADLQAGSDRARETHFLFLDGTIRPYFARACGAVVAPQGSMPFLARCEGAKARVVWRQGKGSLFTLRDTAVSDDGRRVAIAAGAFAQLTDTATGKRATTAFNGLGSMTFLRDHRLLLIQPTGEVSALTTAESRRLVRLALHGETIRASGVDAEGRRALIVTTSGAIAVMDLATGAGQARLPSAPDLRSATTVRFSADDHLAVVVARDRLVVFDLVHRRVAFELDQNGTGQQPRDAVFTPDGRRLAVLRTDQGVQVIDLAPWREEDGGRLLRHVAPALPRALSAQERRELVEAAR